MVNVGKYAIHGSEGLWKVHQTLAAPNKFSSRKLSVLEDDGHLMLFFLGGFN